MNLNLHQGRLAMQSHFIVPLLVLLMLWAVPPPAVLSADPGSSYSDPSTGMQDVLVKGGCYKMGDTFGDGKEDEKPAHEPSRTTRAR